MAPRTVKALPPELFTLRGTNAETNFAALRGTGPLTPIDRFFVRNHTATPHIDAAGWRLKVWGDGLAGGPVEFSYERLRALRAVERTLFIECAGNGRSFYTTQQGQPVNGTAWTLGAIGVAHWRGARLSDVLRLAGVRRDAVDVLPRGLDDEVVSERGEPGAGAAAAAGREGAGRRPARLRDERASRCRPTTASRSASSYRTGSASRRSSGSGDIEVSDDAAVLAVEHRLVPAVRARAPGGRQRAADPADPQERLRAGAGRPPFPCTGRCC